MRLHEILVNFGNPEDFQRMCHQLLELEHPDFQPPDDSRGDGGCDGYSLEEQLGVAIWCPEKMDGYSRRLREKVTSDLPAFDRFRLKTRDHLGVDLDHLYFLMPRDPDPELASWVKALGRERDLTVRFRGTTWLKNRLLQHPQVMEAFPQHFGSVATPAPILEVLLEDVGREEVWPEVFDGQRRRESRLRAVWFQLRVRLLNRGGQPLTVYGARLLLGEEVVAELAPPPASLETRQAHHGLVRQEDLGQYLTPDDACTLERNGAQARRLWLRGDARRFLVPEDQLGQAGYRLELLCNGAPPAEVVLPALRVSRAR